ncbi:DUF2267 domain-containing protein [Myxococcaceae bacterium JPH2]|nr:DUF2267 domain-containing protein [Myxococcaceae bacterium JPH2]
MSMQRQDETLSWSGLGVGTDRPSFLAKVREQLPDYEPEQASEAVCCGLSALLPGGLVAQIRQQLPEDARSLMDGCERKPGADAGRMDRDDFYLHVANHLNAEPENVRLVLHGVFAALQTQITEGEARKIEGQLPRWLAGTWAAARVGIDRPS